MNRLGRLWSPAYQTQTRGCHVSLCCKDGLCADCQGCTHRCHVDLARHRFLGDQLPVGFYHPRKFVRDLEGVFGHTHRLRDWTDSSAAYRLVQLELWVRAVHGWYMHAIVGYANREHLV